MERDSLGHPGQIPLFPADAVVGLGSGGTLRRSSIGRAPVLDEFAPVDGPLLSGGASISYGNAQSLLTPSDGFMSQYKFTLNPYSGCAFGCDYCYARFFARNLTEQQTWGRWVKVKRNALDLLSRALRSKSDALRLCPGDAIYLSSVTDPYQPIEDKLRLTRSLLEGLVEVQPRLTIQTRSPLVIRDIDVLKRFERVRVNITVSTDAEDVRLRYEPHCPSIAVRLKTARELARAGISIGISVSPMLPIRDAEAFGRTLASLAAAEYVTQYLKPSRARFSAGTTALALEQIRDDKWTPTKYQEVRGIIAGILGPARPLLEGAEGYAPP